MVEAQTGFRDREAQFVAWRDVDFQTIKVSQLGNETVSRVKRRSALEDLLRKAQAARPSTCEVESSARLETPFFDQAVERAGGAEKKSIEELLTEIAGPVDSSTIPQFPTAQCLTAEDVYVVESLQPEKQVHLESCPWCKTMVAVAQL